MCFDGRSCGWADGCHVFSTPLWCAQSWVVAGGRSRSGAGNTMLDEVYVLDLIQDRGSGDYKNSPSVIPHEIIYDLSGEAIPLLPPFLDSL